jgi:hypothetical protein
MHVAIIAALSQVPRAALGLLLLKYPRSPSSSRAEPRLRHTRSRLPTPATSVPREC